ncbi:MAG: hypothetical protein ACK5Y2_01325 [Bdellovibrionales bacterium]
MQTPHVLKPVLRLSLIIMTLVVGACATVVPVHEAESPRALGPGGFRLAYISGSSPAMATSGVTTETDSSGETMPTSVFRLGVGVLERFQINLDGGLSALGAATGVSSLKWQYEGKSHFEARKGDVAKSLIVKSWSSSSGSLEVSDLGDSNALFSYVDLELEGFTVSHLWGYRFSDMNGIYGGPQLLQGDLRAEYSDTSDGPILRRDKRRVHGYGLIAGYYFAGLGKNIGFDFALEYQFSRLPGTFQSKLANYSSMALMVGLPFRF